MAMSPTTLNLLLGQILPAMENRWWESPSVWDSEATAPKPNPQRQFCLRWRALSACSWVDVQHNGRLSLGRSLAGHLRMTPCSSRLTTALQGPERGRFLPGQPEAERRRKHFFSSPEVGRGCNALNRGHKNPTSRNGYHIYWDDQT